MTDEQWNAYLKSERATASRTKHTAWYEKESAKVRLKLERRLAEIEAKYDAEKRQLEALRGRLKDDLARRKTKHESDLVSADLKALGLA
jgi:hypothetical protein